MQFRGHGPPADDIWSGIVDAKDDLLEQKDGMLSELQQDLARQKALIERLKKFVHRAVSLPSSLHSIFHGNRGDASR